MDGITLQSMIEDFHGRAQEGSHSPMISTINPLVVPNHIQFCPLDSFLMLYYNSCVEPIPVLISVIITDNKLITGTRIGDMVRIPQRHRATLYSRYYKNYAKSVKLERVGVMQEARKSLI